MELRVRVGPQLTKNVLLATGITNMINFVIPFIIYIIIVCKIPVFEDKLFIHWESKMDAIFTFILICQYFTASLYITIHGRTEFIYSLIFVSIRTTGLVALIFCSTIVIIYKNRHYHQHHQNHNDIDDKHIKLDVTLSNPDTLNLFMNHLSKEYSMECLLSYIEFDQFQKAVIKQATSIANPLIDRINNFPMITPATSSSTSSSMPHPIDTKNTKIKLPDTIQEYDSLAATSPTTPDSPDSAHSAHSAAHSDLELVDIETMKTLRNVPTSAILTATSSIKKGTTIGMDEQTINDFKKRAYLLYEKYCKTGCEFEINISAQMRKNLHEVLGDKQALMNMNMDLATLAKIFDDPKKEMKMLLQYSFTRMKSTEEYVQMVQIIKGSPSV